MHAGGATRRAIGLYHYLPINDLQSLVGVEIEKPQPAVRALRLRIEAASVNPVDGGSSALWRGRASRLEHHGAYYRRRCGPNRDGVGLAAGL
jgi:hypothetical protein